MRGAQRARQSGLQGKPHSCGHHYHRSGKIVIVIVVTVAVELLAFEVKNHFIILFKAVPIERNFSKKRVSG